MKRVIMTLTCIVLIATAAMSVTHYYSVKILSASRAYTNFESQYSKGEKDATRHLMSFIYSHEELDYLYFKNDMSISTGDRIARESLAAGLDYRVARIGFLLAENQREDLPELIWFYNTFKDKSFFKPTIQIWEQEDQLMSLLHKTGEQAYRDIRSGKEVDTEDLVLKIDIISDNLTLKQQRFAASLVQTARMVDHYVFITDIAVSLIILSCSGLLAGIMLRKLHVSKKVIVGQNETLQNMNARINEFVYNVTHDLRAPLSSLTGLVSVLEKEKDFSTLGNYTQMMRETIELQDKNIQEILHSIRNNERPKTAELCNLSDMVKDVISQNSFFAGGQQVKFVNELQVWELKCNITDMRVVFNNLISNAIKYADFSKSEQWIKVRSYQKDRHCIIEIEDNGLGIEPEKRTNIFTKYFKSGANKKSMGLGLFFVKQAIEDMNGTITVNSMFGRGTSFTVSLPL